MVLFLPVGCDGLSLLGWFGARFGARFGVRFGAVSFVLRG